MIHDMRELKYPKLEPMPSIIGTALTSAQGGDKIAILTQWSLLNTENTTDEYIMMIKGRISSMLSDNIFPRILKAFSTKTIPKDFFLYAVYVEMHSDEQKNKILINEDTKFYAVCRPKVGLEIKKNDPITMGNIEELISIEKRNIDPNAATMMLMLNKHGWFGKADLIYNRKNTQMKINRAINFLESAKENLKQSNIDAFYQSLWDCTELLAESVLLLHNQIKLKASHQNIQTAFNEFCEIHRIRVDYEKITQIRNSVRYGPPHPIYKNRTKDAPTLLRSIIDLHDFVLDFLKVREVIPTSFGNNIDLSKTKFSE